MTHKEIQKQRMMRYFIDAAKEIIKEEGVKGITARKIGERAGYSYATMYNYFKDLNTLLIYCAFDFLEDCYQYLAKLKKDTIDSREQILTYLIAYFTYFMENPEIFQLIFLEELGEPPEEMMKDNIPSVVQFLRESIAACVKEGYILEEDVDLLGELIASSIHGKLMFVLKRRSGETIEDIKKSIIREINFLIPEKR